MLGFPLSWWQKKTLTPFALAKTLPVRLMYENRPLAGALVIAMNRQNPLRETFRPNWQ